MADSTVTSSDSTTRPSSSGEADTRFLSQNVRARFALILACFAALHYDILYRIGIFAATDGDWSHAFLVPLISFYMIYQQRDQIDRIAPKTSWLGIPILLAGIALYFYGMYPTQNDMVKGYAMIIEIMGLVLLFTGLPLMRYLFFPILYLVFAVKINEQIWSDIAWQMQLIAAKSSVAVLDILGQTAVVKTTTIELTMPDGKISRLNVAEACSGMRMLMTFAALGVAMAYLWFPRWWARLTLVLLTVPIALFGNISRVTLLGLIYPVNPEFAKGDFHLMLGMFMLIPAMGLFMLISWGLTQLGGGKRTNKENENQPAEIQSTNPTNQPEPRSKPKPNTENSPDSDSVTDSDTASDIAKPPNPDSESRDENANTPIPGGGED